ncbi:hypothetical protein [Poseidonibacter lekithochrous]|uniref:hypothetical protein n=1 Tax=Poseidonibacter lekithochrous TaxID=1904463 RepID=UPI000D342FB3|nr:hypothetical protein [Poseidonibacter lekithochrous]
MKKYISKISEDIIKKDFPIQSKINDWYFKLTETSNGVFEIEGSDRYGRKVSSTGTYVDELVIECENNIKSIQKK